MGASKCAALLLLLVNLFLFSTLGSSALSPKTSVLALSPEASTAPALSPGSVPTCPYLELGICSGMLNFMVYPPENKGRCCSTIGKITGVDAAAVCLCRAFKARVFNVSVGFQFAMHAILNLCGHDSPSGFTCSPN